MRWSRVDQSGKYAAKPSSFASKALGGAALLGSSTLLNAIARLFVAGLMARLLSPADFGVVAAVGIFIELARLLSTSGIAEALVQRPTLTEGEVRTAFTASLIAGVATMGLMCALAGPAADFFAMPRLREAFDVCSLIPPIVSVSAVSSRLLERDHRFGPLALSDLVSYIAASALIGVPLALLGFGVWALILPYIATLALRSAMLFRAQPHRLALRFDLAEYRDLMQLGAGYGLQRFANLIAMKGDYFVAGKLLGPIGLGLYERAYTLMNMSNTLLTAPLSQALFPAFARIAGDNARVRAALARCMGITASFFIPASIVCVALAPEIVGTLLGPRWPDAVVPFAILSSGMFLRTGYKISGIVGNGLGLAYRGAASQSVYAALVVGGALLFSRWGVNGIAVSTLTAIAVVYLLLTNNVLRAIEMRWSALLVTMLPGAVLGILLGAVSWAVAVPLRAAHLHAVVILAVAGAVALAVAGAFALLHPRLLLGEPVLELIRPARSRLPHRLAMLLPE